MAAMVINNKKEFARMVARELLDILKKEGREVEQVLHPERFLTVKAAAKYLGLSESYIYHHKDEIPHSGVCRSLRFTREGLDAYMAQNGMVR
ncbi:MAG: helix-turn-helix domain-containing protein [Prevotella sp.]